MSFVCGSLKAMRRRKRNLPPAPEPDGYIHTHRGKFTYDQIHNDSAFRMFDFDYTPESEMKELIREISIEGVKAMMREIQERKREKELAELQAFRDRQAKNGFTRW